MYKKVTFLVTLIGVLGLFLFTFSEGQVVSASEKTSTTNLSIKVVLLRSLKIKHTRSELQIS